jgi:hypothetical protein
MSALQFVPERKCLVILEVTCSACRAFTKLGTSTRAKRLKKKTVSCLNGSISNSRREMVRTKSAGDEETSSKCQNQTVKRNFWRKMISLIQTKAESCQLKINQIAASINFIKFLQ